MREIKVRARDGATGEILSQLYMGQCFQWVNHEMQHNVIIEQYTGLSDVNGVEIYDGDIIPYRGENYQVEMCGTSWTLKDYEECDYYGHDAPELQDWSEFEVIGNIHQNPELLK